MLNITMELQTHSHEKWGRPVQEEIQPHINVDLKF